MDAIDCAVKKRRETIALYKYLADGASLDSLKRLFAALRDDEQKHLESIASFKERSEIKNVLLKDNGMLPVIFSQIAKDRGIVSLCEEEISFYQEVLEYEKNAVNHYEAMIESFNDKKVRDGMYTIMSQKKMHFNVLNDLCVLISDQQSTR
jgi:rubrerythrin